MTTNFTSQCSDMLFHKHTGEVCDNRDDEPITWNGHLCEGADLVAPIGQEFCLWTKCGKHDVPANEAEIGHMGVVTCLECLYAIDAEPSEAQLGLVPIPNGYREP